MSAIGAILYDQWPARFLIRNVMVNPDKKNIQI